MISIDRNRAISYTWSRQGIGQQEANSGRLMKSFVGIYGTSPTCYLSLAARVRGFRMEDLDEALYLRHTMARIRSMRGSLFLIHKDHLPVVFQSTRHICASAFQRIVSKCGVSEGEYDRTSNEIGDLMAARCMTVAEIRKALKSKSQGVERSLNYIVARMCAEGILTRARVRGGWKSDLFEYARFDYWFPDVDLKSSSPVTAQASLASYYFKSFGPATAEDFHWWSGLSKQEAEKAISSLENKIEKILIQGSDLTYLIMKSDLDKLLLSTDQKMNAIALLPAWDGYIMGYKFRSHYLPEKWAEFIYDKSGNSTSVVMIEGNAGGVWDMEPEGVELNVKIALFEKAKKNTWDELKLQAEELGKIFGFKRITVSDCELPSVPLKNAAQNRFLSPLADAKGEALT